MHLATTRPARKAAPEAGVGGSKNRAWGFFEDGIKRTWEVDPQVVETYLATTKTDPETASGVPYWPSRDPIGELGGVSLYAMVRNNAVGRIDYLGLADESKPIGPEKETKILGSEFLLDDVEIENRYVSKNNCCYIYTEFVTYRTTYALFDVTQAYLTSSNWDEIGTAVQAAGGAIVVAGGVARSPGVVVAGGVVIVAGYVIYMLAPEDMYWEKYIGRTSRVISGPIEIARQSVYKRKVANHECDEKEITTKPWR